ncbi:HAD-IA family hydrolase [Micromonospora sp. NPDC049559]|uniref:HAD family hydrolase n=1 Tax=Micromonospora sp. NPDC049559 TaxID=3155923 RepID=UPI003424916A
MRQPVIFDLFHTLVHGADGARDRVVGEMARVVGVDPAATLDVLDALRADGHPLALVSNATSDTAEAWPDGPLARRFDVAVFSCEVGLAKPDPAIYRAAADRLGADPAGCVFVGDGADGELAGAADAYPNPVAGARP